MNNRSNKRFLLFGGDRYYPLGGWFDIYKGYDTLKEAVADAKQTFRDAPDYEWWHVYDQKLKKVVLNG